MNNISIETLECWIKEKIDFQLIDVRSPEEHALHNIGGELIPLEELIRRRGEISAIKNVVFYCRKGIRSQIAIQRLEEYMQGNFYNLKGGVGDKKV